MINIRLENPRDYRRVEEITREAFWGFTNPTCDEHYLVHKLRSVPAFIQELDMVAEIKGELVGNVMYSKSKVVDEEGKEHEVITFGPLSVLPEYWKNGVGSSLMKYSILKARDLGYNGIVFHGHPDYYPRFGFQSSDVFGITNMFGSNYDALMAMELYDGAMKSIRGKFYEDSVFHCDETEAKKYNTLFPAKEAANMISIDVLLNKLPETTHKAFKERNITTLAWLNRFSGREILKWDGITECTLRIINCTLKENNYSEKLFPDCEILKRAKEGIKVLESDGI